ncbi:hypothetical protein GC197_10245 [bacterium]|nr:hypothetical protein [bacterium]
MEKSDQATFSRVFPAVVFAFAILCFLGSLQEGVDSLYYQYWANTTYEGRILWDSGGYVSPTGIPPYQWSSGPGLLLAPFYFALFPFHFDPIWVVAIAGAFYTACFWTLFYASLREAFDDKLALLGVLIAFVATPLGYYSRSISSESLSLFPAGILLYQTVLIWKRKENVNWWAIGSATYLLLIIRPYLGVYAWPVLLVGWFQESGAGRLRSLAISTVFIGVALLQIGTANYWITGNPWRSPYSYGDDEFRSLDFAHPRYIDNVLFDSLHGEIPIHPLVGIGLVALFIWTIQQARQKQWSSVGLGALSLIAVAINVWFQGSYYWWCSTYGFGLRGLYLMGIPASIVVVGMLHHAQKWQVLASVVVGVCSGWSFLAMMQGPADYLTWHDFLAGYWGQTVDIVLSYQLAVVAVSFGLAFFCIWPKSSTEWLTVVLAGLTLAYLLIRGYAGIRWALLLPILAVVAGFVYGKLRLSQPVWVLQHLAPVVALLVILLFGRLTSVIHPLLKPTPDAISFQTNDIVGAWILISQQDRDDSQEAAKRLAAYLERNGVDVEQEKSSQRLREQSFTYEQIREQRRKGTRSFP